MKRTILSLLFLASMALLIASCKKEAKPQPDHSIIMTSNSASLSAGTSKQLASKNYSASQLTWASSDTTVATVDATGLVTTLKPGTIVITIKSQTYSVSTTCNVTVTQAKLTDIGVGADGSVFVIGSDTANTTGGHSIYKLVNGELHKLQGCTGIRIAVSPQGAPWVVNESNLIFKYNAGAWTQLPGTGSDIGIGADGSVFAVGTQLSTVTGGYIIMKWNGSNWDTMPQCAGIRIAVSPAGIPWVINLSNLVYEYGGYLWTQMPGVAAADIGIGGDGSVFVTGADTGVPAYTPPIYQFNGGSWSQVPGLSNGTSISVDAHGKVWYIDKSGFLHIPTN
jgi:hypothetical protein